MYLTCQYFFSVAAVVFFAVVFGVALSRVMDKRAAKGIDISIIMSFLKELDGVFLIMINWIIKLTPCK